MELRMKVAVKVEERLLLKVAHAYHSLHPVLATSRFTSNTRSRNWIGRYWQKGFKLAYELGMLHVTRVI